MSTLKKILKNVIGFFLWLLCVIGGGLYIAFGYCLACIIYIGAILFPVIPFIAVIWLISLLF